MKRTEDPNYRTLQWILNFLSKDLDGLTELEFSHLTVDARYFFVNQWLTLPWMGIPDVEDRARAKDAKVGFAFSSAWPEGYPWRDTVAEVQEELGEIVKVVLEQTAEMAKRDNDAFVSVFKDIGKVDMSLGISNKGTFLAYRVLEETVPKITYDPSTFIHLARMSLYRTLAAMPQWAIGECRECKGYFARLRDKPRYFCSIKCQKAFDSRERRLSDPEAYRAKQRKVMRQRYAEKRARELDISVEEMLKRIASRKKRAEAKKQEDKQNESV